MHEFNLRLALYPGNKLQKKLSVCMCVSVFINFLSAFPSQDASIGQKCLEVMSEEFKTEICEMPCQIQAAVESVQLGSTVRKLNKSSFRNNKS